MGADASRRSKLRVPSARLRAWRDEAAVRVAEDGGEEEEEEEAAEEEAAA